jgi:hypothetical protein
MPLYWIMAALLYRRYVSTVDIDISTLDLVLCFQAYASLYMIIFHAAHGCTVLYCCVAAPRSPGDEAGGGVTIGLTKENTIIAHS